MRSLVAYLRSRRWPVILHRCYALIGISLALFPPLEGQTDTSERPIPILTGGAGFLSNVNDGHSELVPMVSPLLLVPFGDRWLVESRAEFKGEFERQASGSYTGRVEKELDYLQLDYIANPFLTLTVGRFLTPFGIYNERLYPVWIRNLPSTPLIFPIGTGSSNGAMLRGGFPLTTKVNLNYAVYFSALSTIKKLDSDRTSGARMGIFLPGPRLEFGASFQKLLQEERSRSAGFHFAWQPTALPLSLRSEYAWSGNKGSGYWAEAAYRLNQAPRWQSVMRHVEVVARMQQFFAGSLQSSDAAEYGLPDINTRQADLGVNYYLRDGLRATASWGRQFSSQRDLNVWTVGIAYRFALPLGRLANP